MTKILIDEATVKLALEALEVLGWQPTEEAMDYRDNAITALREALAEQPAQQDCTCSNALRIQGKAYPRTCKKCELGPCVELAQQALDKKAENARELGLDYEVPITMQEGEFDCTHAERLCAELKAAHPVTPCTHPSLGACSLREDGTASRWNCVMCGTEFVPKATNRWAEFNEATKRNMEHAEWYLSTHPQPAQQESHGWYIDGYGAVLGASEPKSVRPGEWLPFYTAPQASKPWVWLVHEETHEAIGTAGADLLELAKLWSDNKVHVYQFDNEARKIIEAVLRCASAKLREKNA